MSLRTCSDEEFNQDDRAAIQFSNGSRNARLYSEARRSVNYESSKPVLDPSIENGQIVVDHTLAHGQRFYFAEGEEWDMYALSSQCHRY